MGIHISPSPIQQQKFPCKTCIELFMKNISTIFTDSWYMG